ncbi:MAG TPA: hypothetical protein DCS13_04825 [Candidatus Margulisbacteria bacterium]|nr:hypothetical protein [Candidatus Margulisiibacteriota bacterium]
MNYTKFLAACLLVLLFSPAHSMTISLDEVLSQAISYSYDLQQSAIDIDISRANERSRNSLYLPALKLRFNSEYTKDLLSNKSNVVSIGDSLLGNSTKYQDSISIILTSPLFYYDILQKRSYIDRQDVSMKSLIHRKNQVDLKVHILEMYKKILLLSKELFVKKELFLCYKELFNLKDRLNNAGSVSKVEVADQALEIAYIVNGIDSLKLKLRDALLDLSFYTGISYDEEALIIKNIDSDWIAGKEITVSANNSLEYRICQLELEKKKAELDIALKENWPKIDLYVQYALYGSDKESLKTALRDMKGTSLTAGISSSLGLFDGFRNAANIERLTLELKRLEIESNKIIFQTKQNQLKLVMLLNQHSTGLQNNKEIVTKINSKSAMIGKLVQQQITDRESVLVNRINETNQKFELERNNITMVSEIKKMVLLSEVDN